MKTPSNLKWIFVYKVEVLRPYSKSSLALTLNKWRFNLSFSWVSMLFLNSCRVSSYIVRYDTNPPAIQKQDWHWREAQIETPLIECAFRIRALISLLFYVSWKNNSYVWSCLQWSRFAGRDGMILTIDLNETEFKRRLKELKCWRALVVQKDCNCCLNNLRLQLYCNLSLEKQCSFAGTNRYLFQYVKIIPLLISTRQSEI
jgi:hypothetical protein